MLNKQYPVTGRKHTPNKCYAPNSEVRLITRVYGISDTTIKLLSLLSKPTDLLFASGRHSWRLTVPAAVALVSLAWGEECILHVQDTCTTCKAWEEECILHVPHSK